MLFFNIHTDVQCYYNSRRIKRSHKFEAFLYAYMSVASQVQTGGLILKRCSYLKSKHRSPSSLTVTRYNYIEKLINTANDFNKKATSNINLLLKQLS